MIFATIEEFTLCKGKELIDVRFKTCIKNGKEIQYYTFYYDDKTEEDVCFEIYREMQLSFYWYNDDLVRGFASSFLFKIKMWYNISVRSLVQHTINVKEVFKWKRQ